MPVSFRRRGSVRGIVSAVWTVFLLLIILVMPGRASALETISREGLDALLQANRGKVILVSYWATWCSSCRKEIPELKKIRADFSEDALSLVGISLDTNAGQLSAFMKRAGFNYDIFQVPEKSMSGFSEIEVLPTLVFYKKNGAKGWTHTGYMRPEEIRRTIAIFSRDQ